MARRWLVTGCSTGLGRVVVEAAAAAGDQVLATARRPETLDELVQRYPDSVVTARLDVREDDHCEAAVRLAVERFGGIDVLVHNAAYGLFGAVEEIADDELRDLMETNVVGPWRLTRHAMPVLRAQGSGHLVLVSSANAYVPFHGLSAYTMSKFALEGLGETLAMETEPFGIKVTILQPGGFITEWGRSMVESRTRLDAYEPHNAPLLAGIRKVEEVTGALPAAGFAEVMMRLVEMDQPLLRLPVTPFGWQSAVNVARGRHEALIATAAATGVAIPTEQVQHVDRTTERHAAPASTATAVQVRCGR